MLIRGYKLEDKDYVINLGKILHENFKLELDTFSKIDILEDNNKIIGFIIYSIIYERAEIVDIIIDAEYRKKGYGNKLLNNAINKIEESNCHNISLEVNCNNESAINLYKKNGFQIISTRKNYYNGIDGYLMVKELR